MKNIHVLPTENSSTLSINKGKLILHRPQWRKGTQYMYITSDEEIKEGDWCLDIIHNTVSKRSDNKYKSQYKKIILTTDRELNKDGVWGIADDILKWYVKNPTCEYVELKGYAIILPGESCDCDIMCSACKEEEVVDGLTMGQIPANEETREYDLLQHIKFCLECKNESQAIRLIEKYGFQKQEERYSEEEVLLFLHKRDSHHINTHSLGGWKSPKEWFEQFKK